MVKKYEQVSAAEADWSVAEDETVVRAVEIAAHKASNYYPLADVSDCRQEGYLHLAVRPEMVQSMRDSGHFEQRLIREVYAHALRPMLDQEAKLQAKQIPYEEWEND